MILSVRPFETKNFAMNGFSGLVLFFFASIKKTAMIKMLIIKRFKNIIALVM